MVRPTTQRRLNMDVNATTGIRELTAQELDQVTGGASWSEGMTGGEWGFIISVGGAVLYGAVAGLLEWLFG
jgi:hypothetical protein